MNKNKTAVVITGDFDLEFPNLDHAVRYARTQLTFEGLKETRILFAGKVLKDIRKSYGDTGETIKKRPYGVLTPGFKVTGVYASLEEAISKAKPGDEVYSWRDGTHRVRITVE